MTPPDPRFDERLGAAAPLVTAIFDALPIGISVMWPVRDAAGTITDFALGYANATAARLLGVSLDGELGTRLREAMPGLVAMGQFDRFARVADTGEPDSSELVIDTLWRDVVQVSGVWANTVLPFDEGVLSVSFDVTDERRRQRELRDFAAVAAHDLREPLIGINLMTMALLSTPDLPAERRPLVELIGDGVQSARRLVDGILEYAGAENESIARGPVDCDAVVAEVLDVLALQIREREARVDVGALPTVRASGNGLRRVFQNLIANGLKFRDPARPPHLHVAAARDGDGWGFSVRDNGIGLPSGRPIFEMFQRGGGDTEGSGIGLATCRRIVEAHGGRIWAEPAAGGGSVFSFTLPADATEVRLP
jgi:signal transduction histidine kinase